MPDDQEIPVDATDEATLSIRREILDLEPDAGIDEIETATLRARNARYKLALDADEAELEKAVLAEVLDALGLDTLDAENEPDTIDDARERRRAA